MDQGRFGGIKRLFTR